MRLSFGQVPEKGVIVSKRQIKAMEERSDCQGVRLEF